MLIIKKKGTSGDEDKEKESICMVPHRCYGLGVSAADGGCVCCAKDKNGFGQI